MSQCKRDEASRNLAMAISPEEFPSEAAELEAHVQDCQGCQEELHALRLIDAFLREHKDALADERSACPSAEDLVEFAQTGEADPSCTTHIASCTSCSEEVGLARGVNREDLSAGFERPPSVQRRFIMACVEREYGRPAPSWHSRLAALVTAVRDRLSFPSMLVGAVAAAALVVCLLPQGKGTGAMVPALSAVTWDVPDASMQKIPSQPVAPAGMTPLVADKKIAVIILVSEKDQLSQSVLDRIYREVDIATKLSGSYRFVSPKEIQKALGTPKPVDDPDRLALTVFRKVPAHYVLFVRIEKQDSLYSLWGMLYERGQNAKRARISHMGIPMDRIPSHITTIGSELLLEADFS
jgi:hypothetical protein